MTSREEVLRRHLLLAACCVVLGAVALSSAPGQVGIDTKLDLVVDPWAIMLRSLDVWDPNGYFGQLQNQGYGYLFPMGPFFAAGLAVGTPAWLVQAAWHTVLLIGAFLGAQRVARSQRLSFGAAVLAGAAYALSPRILTTLGAISSESLPMAVAPWVLLPLLRWRPGASGRRTAAASAVALLLAGGVNAVATLAVLVLPVLWFAVHLHDRAVRRLALWWGAATAAACAWWLVPLLVLGRYSPPFLDWIETSSVTTSVTSLLDTVRGTSHWLARIVDATGPLWPAGWALVTAPAAVLAVAVLGGVGLAGLTRRLPAGPVWRLGVLAGLVLVASGFSLSVVHGAAAAPVQELLDGPLAPLRNVHKFDAALRLPLVVGLGAALDAVRARLAAPAQAPVRRVVVAALVGALAVQVTPAVAGQLAVDPRTEVLAAHYREAADWLERNADGTRSLVVPSAPFASYTWGRTGDDALQPLLDVPWAVRDAQPLSSAGAIRVMDAVNNQLSSGRGGPALAPFLARAGVGHLVVRNDLDWYDGGSTRPAVVREALGSAPGLRKVAGFGPLTPTGREGTGTTDFHTAGGVDAVEVWAVDDAWGRVELLPTTAPYVVDGGPEALLGMAEQGWLDDRPVFLAGDPQGRAPDDATTVVTDTLRRREYGFGAVRDNVSATLAADEAFRTRRPVHDYLPFPVGATDMTVARYPGVDALSASSSGSDVTATVGRAVSHQPWSALDGDATTSWTSGSLDATGEWWQVRFETPVDLDGVRIAFAPSPATAPTSLRVRTDQGESLVEVSADTRLQEVAVPAGPTSLLRISAADVGPAPRFSFWGLSTVEVPGLLASRTLDVASSAPAGSRAEMLTFRTVPGYHADCVVLDDVPRCNPQAAAAGEEDSVLDRSFELAADVPGEVRLRARPLPGEALDTWLAERRPGPRATASSALSADPRAGAAAAVDGDGSTGWIAAPGDEQPTLTLRWDAPVELRSLTLDHGDDLPAGRPERVRVTAGDLEVEREVGSDGRVALPRAVRTDELAVEVLEASLLVSTDSGSGRQEVLPVGISEVGVDGAAVSPDGWLDREADAGCGSGPTVLLDGTRYRTSFTATPRAVRDLEEVTAELCEAAGLPLPAGPHRLRVESSELLAPTSVGLPGSGAGTVPARRPAQVRSWEPTARALEVDAPDGAVLTLAENFNDGWRASLDGEPLAAVRVDGWRQAFVLPPGATGTVEMSFGPAGIYRLGLAVGGLLALLCVLALVLPARRRAGVADPLPAPAAAPWAPVLVAGSVGLALVLTAGWVGAATVLIVAAVPALGVLAGRLAVMRHPGRTDDPAVRAVVAAVLVAGAGALDAAGLALAGRPLAGSGAAQVLVAVAVAVACWPPGLGDAVRRWTQATAGRSTR